MKRVIVEGMDGSGKTTLIHLLHSKLPGAVVVPGFKKSQEPDYETWLLQTLNYNNFPSSSIAVHDRLFYSELVYGPVLRHGINLSGDIYNIVTHFLRQKAFLIYCRVPYSYLLDSVSVHPQMEGVIANLPVLYEQYEHTMMEEVGHYGERFMVWDFTYMQIEEVLDRLVEYAGS